MAKIAFSLGALRCIILLQQLLAQSSVSSPVRARESGKEWLRLRGGGSLSQPVRAGTVDYTKWERLAETVSDDDPSEIKPQCRVTTLAQPSTVEVQGEECIIHGDIISQQPSESFSPQPQTQQSHDAAPRQQSHDAAPGQQSEDAAPRQQSEDAAQSAPILQASPPKDHKGSLKRQHHHKSSVRDIATPPKFISEEKLLGNKKPEDLPLIQEWIPNASAWKAVDYSKWDALEVSDNAEPHHDKHSDDSLTEDEDQQVRDQVRSSIERAVAARDEEKLRRALKHAEPLVKVGLMTEQELAAGKETLCQLGKDWSNRGNSTSNQTLQGHDTLAAAKEQLTSMTRNGGRTNSFLWSQTKDQVTLHIWVAQHVRGVDLTLLVREKRLRVTLHEPQRIRAHDLVRIPAEERRAVGILFESKLAYRVRAADNGTDWELVNVSDVSPDGTAVEARRALRVVLNKQPPGAHFFPSVLPEWDPEYDGPGQWRESIVYVWWDRIRPTDTPLDVTTLPDRLGNPRASDSVWREAEEMFRAKVHSIRKVDLSGLVESEHMEQALNHTRTRLEAQGVRPGSADWEEGIRLAEAEARETAQAEMDAAIADRRRADEEERQREAAWEAARAERLEARRRLGLDEREWSSSEEDRLLSEALFRPSL